MLYALAAASNQQVMLPPLPGDKREAIRPYSLDSSAHLWRPFRTHAQDPDLPVYYLSRMEAITSWAGFV